MEPWYKGVPPRGEVRAGRSFNPDEFAIHLEQVVAGHAPADYRDPAQFFSRNVFTRALTDLVATVLRRLAGQTANAPPVLTPVTQFGGGKTHALRALYHLVRHAGQARRFAGVPQVLDAAGLAEVPAARGRARVAPRSRRPARSRRDSARGACRRARSRPARGVRPGGWGSACASHRPGAAGRMGSPPGHRRAPRRGPQRRPSGAPSPCAAAAAR